MEDLDKILGVAVVFLGLPWLIFHYVTRWKTAATITGEDERLLDELHDVARRLEDRVTTIERIMTAENPGWRQLAAEQPGVAIEDNVSGKRIVQ